MKILNTRSRHEDTDRASASVAVADAGAQTVAKDLGDVNNGDYEIDLTVGPVAVGSNEDGVAFNYLIVNAGNASWDDVNQKLHQAGDKLAEAGAKAATAGRGRRGRGRRSARWSCRSSAASSAPSPAGSPEAAFKGQDLLYKTKDGPHEFSTVHDGTDYAAGCGSNSVYWVDWRLARA